MFKTKFKSISAVFFLILLGSILRIYNLNFDDFWYDEMVSFWLSDPNLTFFGMFEPIYFLLIVVSASFIFILIALIEIISPIPLY